jgi:hypothetical protein
VPVKVALAAGTTTTISTTGTTTYGINGKAYSKAAITNGATPTTDAPPAWRSPRSAPTRARSWWSAWTPPAT